MPRFATEMDLFGITRFDPIEIRNSGTTWWIVLKAYNAENDCVFELTTFAENELQASYLVGCIVDGAKPPEHDFTAINPDIPF